MKPKTKPTVSAAARDLHARITAALSAFHEEVRALPWGKDEDGTDRPEVFILALAGTDDGTATNACHTACARGDQVIRALATMANKNNVHPMLLVAKMMELELANKSETSEEN